ncbi:MAG: ubiquinone-binding protein [Hyphomicrobiales bacterium]|nr:MAG: ubiquinone-binding protein [Hyphomicrobiales bacterium]
MPNFSKTHRIQHSVDEMFALVADVEKYPEYVPLCQALSIRSQREKAGRRILLADMTAGYKSVRETFTCQVILQPKEHIIQVSYIDGPFKYLDNKWHFSEQGKGRCEVQFELDYEFKSKALALLLGSMFDRAFAHFTKAFEERADELYGHNSA